MISPTTWATSVLFLSQGKPVVSLWLNEAVDVWRRLTPAAQDLVRLELERDIKLPRGQTGQLNAGDLSFLVYLKSAK